MGLMQKAFLAAALLLALLLPGRAHAAPAADEVVLGGSFTLGEGETIEGDLLVIGGNADIEAGAQVLGDITQLGGSLWIDGFVDGDVTQLGGSLVLESRAEITGDVQTGGGAFDREEGAQVGGSVRSGWTEVNVAQPEPANRFAKFVIDGFWNLFKIFASAALAVVLTLLWPQRLDVVGQALIANPVMAGGVGLLVVGVSIPVLLIAAITILLIPVTFLGAAILAAAAGFGWSALSLEVGRRIGEAANKDWSPSLAAGLGAILLGIIFISVEQLPCIGWAMQVMMGMIVLGAVAITRLGEEFQ